MRRRWGGMARREEEEEAGERKARTARRAIDTAWYDV